MVWSAKWRITLALSPGLRTRSGLRAECGGAGQQLFYETFSRPNIKVTFTTSHLKPGMDVTGYQELCGPIPSSCSNFKYGLFGYMTIIKYYKECKCTPGIYQGKDIQTSFSFQQKDFNSLPHSPRDSPSVTAWQRGLSEPCIAWSALMRKCCVSVTMSQMLNSELVSNSKHIGDNKIWPQVHFSALHMTLANDRFVTWICLPSPASIKCILPSSGWR